MNLHTHTPHGLPRESEVYQTATRLMFAYAQTQGLSFDQAASVARLHPMYPVVTQEMAAKAIETFRQRGKISHPCHRLPNRSHLNMNDVQQRGRTMFLDPHQ